MGSNPILSARYNCIGTYVFRYGEILKLVEEAPLLRV